MMEFIILTASFTIAILLASAVSCVIMFKLMTSKKVMKWYMNWVMKISNDFVESIELSNEDGKL